MSVQLNPLLGDLHGLFRKRKYYWSSSGHTLLLQLWNKNAKCALAIIPSMTNINRQPHESPQELLVKLHFVLALSIWQSFQYPRNVLLYTQVWFAAVCYQVQTSLPSSCRRSCPFHLQFSRLSSYYTHNLDCLESNPDVLGFDHASTACDLDVKWWHWGNDRSCLLCEWSWFTMNWARPDILYSV